MTNNTPPGDDAPPFDSKALEEWLAETSERKEMSEQELFDEVLSSYWILEELSGLIADPDARADRSTNRRDAGAGDGTDGASATESGAVDRSMNGVSELKGELRQLRSVIQELAGDNGRSRRHGDRSALESEITELEDRLEELAEAVDEQKEVRNRAIEQLHGNVTDVHGRLSELEAETDSFAEEATVERTLNQVERSQEDLESRVESEFDSIKRILQHLLETTDDLEQRLKAVSSSYQNHLESLKEFKTSQERLVEIKEEAMMLEIDAAVCEACDQRIDLSLLETPHCPNCDRSFRGVSSGGWSPLSKPTVETVEPEGNITGTPSDQGLYERWQRMADDGSGEDRPRPD